MFDFILKISVPSSFPIISVFLWATAWKKLKRSRFTSDRRPEQAFAFLELKTMELATAVLELDGIVFKETQLKMRRPSDYNPQLVPAA